MLESALMAMNLDLAPGLRSALLPSAAVLLRMPLASGVAAGVAGALLPLKYETETGGEWEAPEAAVLSLVLLVLTISCAGSARSPCRSSS
jgi:hypothetical protein